VADQADHFAGLDDQIDIAGDGAGAVAEAGLLQLDAAGDAGQMHRVGRLGHAGNVVEDVEDALGAGCGALGGRHDAAHRIQAGVEAADVGEEGGEHADRVALGNLPDAEDPDDEQADFGEQGDGRVNSDQVLFSLSFIAGCARWRHGNARPRAFPGQRP
jgi:hypothetical protein